MKILETLIFFLQLDRSTREIELGLDYGTPNMNLTGQSLKFENGQWIAGEELLLLLWSGRVVELHDDYNFGLSLL